MLSRQSCPGTAAARTASIAALVPSLARSTAAPSTESTVASGPIASAMAAANTAPASRP